MGKKRGRWQTLEIVGILGGTFDPIHMGHIAMAEAVQRELGIRHILLVPDGDPPHKGAMATAKDRLHMARLAVENRPGLEVSDIETRRPGTTYTVDTLKRLVDKYPGEYIYIVGSDTLLVIESWRRFDEVARLLKGLVVVPRPGDEQDEILAFAETLTGRYGLRVHVLNAQVSPLSSTMIRRLAARSKSLKGLVPPGVEKYIRSHRLYRDPMIEELRETMTQARFRHTLGVEETAVKLAEIHGADREQARLAALLHDCAKHLEVKEMVRLVDKAGIETAPGEKESRALLHAAAGVVLARKRFGVEDPEVLSAIRWHTTGKKDMSLLDRIIYLADMIEPGRRPFPGMEEIRSAAYIDLDRAMRIAAGRTVRYVRSRGMPLNERTLELLKSLENDGIKENEA
jgi:nicotinate-nucleotide adenylyltransferase